MFTPLFPEDKLFIFMDTYGIEKKIDSDISSNLERLSRYFKSNYFGFGRSSSETKNKFLAQVTEFSLNYKRITDFQDISIEYTLENVEGNDLMGLNKETAGLLAKEAPFWRKNQSE